MQEKLWFVSHLLTYPIHWDQVRRIAESWNGPVQLVDLGEIKVDAGHRAHGGRSLQDVRYWSCSIKVDSLAGFSTRQRLCFWYHHLRFAPSDVVWYIGEPIEFELLELLLLRNLGLGISVWSSACENEFRYRLCRRGAIRAALKFAMYSILWRRLAGVFATGRESFESLRQVGMPSNVKCISPVGGSRDLGTRRIGKVSKAFTICFVGRLVVEKGLWTLLDAFRRLDERFSLVICGEGKLRDTIEAYCKNHDLQARVTILGLVGTDKVVETLHRSDVLVCPSISTVGWREQFGLAVVEAMSAGLPVVVSNSGALPEVVGNAGLVFPEGNSDALFEILRRLIDDNVLREALSSGGRARFAANFSIDAVAMKIASHLQTSKRKNIDENCI